MPINFEELITSAGVNAEFVFKEADDTKTGVLALRKNPSDPNEILDLQDFVNELASVIGVNGESDPNANTYSSEIIITNGDDRKSAIGKLDAQVSTNESNISTNTSDIDNNKRTTYSNEVVEDSGEITVDNNILTQVRRISGDGSAITTSTTPFGDSSSTKDGLIIILRGFDASNTVTIKNNDIQYGAILNGDATLGLYDQLVLMYDSIAERWIEQQRNF